MRWKIFMFKTLQKLKLINISTKRWYILSYFTDEAWPKLSRQPGWYWDIDFNKTWETWSSRTSHFSWGLGHCLQPAGSCRKTLSTTWWEKCFFSQVLKSSHRLVNCFIPYIISSDLIYMKLRLSLTNFGEFGTDSISFLPLPKKKVRSEMQLSVFSPQSYCNENSSQWPMLILVSIRPHIYMDVHNVKP